MRPLPDLTPLPQQPAVYDSGHDSFVSYFASDFQQMDSLSSTAQSEQNTVNNGIQSIVQAINDLAGAISDSQTVFDGLSNELDSVNLVPDILEYQAADTALAANLDNSTFDLTGALDFFGNLAVSLLSSIWSTVSNAILNVYQTLENEIANVFYQIGEIWNMLGGAAYF